MTIKRYLHNTSWLLGEKIVRMVSILGVGVWMARYLGPEKFGLLSYAIAFTALFSPFVSLGLDKIVVRELVKLPDETNEILGTALTLKLISGLLTFSLIVSISFLIISDNLSEFWMIVIVSAGILFRGLDVIDLELQSLVRSKNSALVKGTATLVVSLVNVVLILLKAPLMAFALTVMAELFLVALGLLLVNRMFCSNILFWTFDKNRAKRLLSDSWPVIFAGLSIMLYMRSDQIMLGQMIGDQAVGLYSATIRISEASYVIPTVISQSLFPAIIYAKQKNEMLYRARLQNLFTALVFISYAISVPMMFYSDAIIGVLYGEMYRSASMVLTIHIWTSVCVSLGAVSGSWYAAENLLKLSFYRTLIGGGANVLLNLLFIPQYGIVGAAVASLGSFIFVTLIFDFFSQVSRPIFHMKMRSLLVFQELFRVVQYLRQSR